MIGVYLLKNNLNGRCYVGSSTNLSQRKKEHKSKFRLGKVNSNFKDEVLDFNNFSFIILEEFIFGDWCKKEYIEEIITSLEQYYVDTLKPYYNIRKEVDTNKNITLSEENLNHLRTVNIGRKASPERVKK